MESLHFIMVYNADGIDNARELAIRELQKFGMRKMGEPDWYKIISVYKDDESEFTCDSFDQKHYTVKDANELINTKWLTGYFSDEMKAAVAKVKFNDGKPSTEAMTFKEICIVSNYYENVLESNRVLKKLGHKSFNILNNDEFNANLYSEYGVTWIVNSFDGNENFIVAVTKK